MKIRWTNANIVQKLIFSEVMKLSVWYGCEDDFAHLVWPPGESFLRKKKREVLLACENQFPTAKKVNENPANSQIFLSFFEFLLLKQLSLCFLVFTPEM